MDLDGSKEIDKEETAKYWYEIVKWLNNLNQKEKLRKSQYEGTI